MNTREYSQLARRTEAPQPAILQRLIALGDYAMQLDNGARGLSDECGEISGCVKRHIEYGQPLDIANLKEEVGDCLWRLDQICRAAGFTLEDAMRANINKLAIRYKDSYSDYLADELNRNRKAERETMEID